MESAYICIQLRYFLHLFLSTDSSGPKAVGVRLGCWRSVITLALVSMPNWYNWLLSFTLYWKIVVLYAVVACASDNKHRLLDHLTTW